MKCLLHIQKKESDGTKLILHWGIYYVNHHGRWNHPPKESYPINTIEFDKNALQTEFAPEERGFKDNS